MRRGSYREIDSRRPSSFVVSVTANSTASKRTHSYLHSLLLTTQWACSTWDHKPTATLDASVLPPIIPIGKGCDRARCSQLRNSGQWIRSIRREEAYLWMEDSSQVFVLPTTPNCSRILTLKWGRCMHRQSKEKDGTANQPEESTDWEERLVWEKGFSRKTLSETASCATSDGG